MRAWLQTGFGGPEVRRLTEVPDPVPAADEVLVRVQACAFNRLDVLQRIAPVIPVFALPHIAGMDVCGEVVASGGDEGEPLVGRTIVLDPVVVCGVCDRCRADLPMYCRVLRTVGSTRPGGFAELVAVPARNCVPVEPGRLTAAEYAAIPVASVTAWHALVTVGRLEAGETVVVPAAGSGVGGAAILMAKRLGARVITTVGGAHKIPAAEALGADVVLDRSAVDWWTAVLGVTGGEGADLVLDHVGGPFLQQAIEALRPDGRVVVSGTTAGDRSTIHTPALYHWGKRVLGHGGYRHAELVDVVEWHGRGDLPVIVDRVYGFDELPEAEARLESGAASGKVVVCLP